MKIRGSKLMDVFFIWLSRRHKNIAQEKLQFFLIKALNYFAIFADAALKPICLYKYNLFKVFIIWIFVCNEQAQKLLGRFQWNFEIKID